MYYYAYVNQKIIKNVFKCYSRNRPDNYVAFTFFIGPYFDVNASVFFFIERGSVDKKWKMSLLVSALITGIAATLLLHERLQLTTGDSPTFFRYVDWILTVPLMCVGLFINKGFVGCLYYGN